MTDLLIDAKQKELSGWAEVRAHDRVVRYRRSGAGPAVLLLQPASPTGGAPFWPELAAMIGDGRRLIVPDPPADELEVEAWLSALVEGMLASSVQSAAVPFVVLRRDRPVSEILPIVASFLGG